jgi:tetratricopeptide (TPR) repeat protein
MNNLAAAYWAAGQLKKALPLFEQTLVKRKDRLGSDHPDTLQSMHNLATAYQDAGQLAKAEKLYRQILQQAQEQDPESPQTAALMAVLSLNLLQQKKYADAEPVLRECLAIREQKQPGFWATFSTQSMLGGALLGQKKYAEAEPLLSKGYQGMKNQEEKIPPQGKVRLVEALERLVQLYEATGRKDEAAKWRKRLLQAQEAQKKPLARRRATPATESKTASGKP